MMLNLDIMYLTNSEVYRIFMTICSAAEE